MKYKIILLLLLIGRPLAAGKIYHTGTPQNDIKTLRMQYLQHTGNPVRPYLRLVNGCVDGTDEENTLEMSFDCMSHDLRQYTYTIYHLNRDMQRSDLQSFEYLQGFTTQDITDYRYSNNTQEVYIHYALTFPNNDMQLTCSGNYVLHVYEDGDPEKTVADFVFQVVNPQVEIAPTLRSHTDIELNGRYQQLDIDLDTRHITYNSPDELSLVVQQNNRTDNIVTTRPNYVEPNRLRYLNNRDLIYEGGNEYRHLDIYSPYYAGYNVNRVRYGNGAYHAFLEADDNRGVTATTDKTGSPYLYEQDTDGQWLINTEHSDDDDTDAEYMWVHWTLPMKMPFFDGSVYVGGDLFQNEMTIHNRMLYDNEQECYYLNAMLKQGAYDYQYWFKRKGETKATLLNVEGSHWQTENEYTIFVYLRPIGERYDQLVGLKRIQSSAR